jgi:hypothetical protein
MKLQIIGGPLDGSFVSAFAPTSSGETFDVPWRDERGELRAVRLRFTGEALQYVSDRSLDEARRRAARRRLP